MEAKCSYSEVMELRNIGVNATGSIGRHCHRDEGVFEFHYFLDGSGFFSNAEVSYPVKPGELFFSRPHENHDAKEDPNGPRMVVYNLSFHARDGGDEGFVALLNRQFQASALLSIGKGYGLLFEDLRRKMASPDPLFRLSALHRFLAQGLGLGIAREGHRGIAPDLAGELIEQQHQRQPALGGFAPAAQLAGDGLAGEAQESLPQQRISCR